MRGAIVLAAAALLVGVGAAIAATEHQVSLTAGGPQPVELTVKWGDSVTFTNADSGTQNLQIPRLDIATDIAAGATFTQTFNGRRGAYTFRQRLGNRLHSGTIVVDVSGDLTLSVTPRSSRYGQSLQVSGRSPFGEAPVELEAQPVGGGGTRVKLATVTPSADGSFATSVKLERGGRILAFAAGRQVRSAAVPVTVTPVLTATARPRRVAAKRFVKVSGRLRPAQAASAATLEAYDTRRKRWIRSKSTRVPQSGAVAFSFRAVKGTTRYRVTVLRNGLRTGYTTVTSSVMTVTGT